MAFLGGLILCRSFCFFFLVLVVFLFVIMLPKIFESKKVGNSILHFLIVCFESGEYKP